MASANKFRFADVAVTATANEFAGIYRGKKQHEPDFDAVLDRALEYGVEKVMLTGMLLDDVQFHLDIVRRRPRQCFFTIGVHPYHANEPEEQGPNYFEKMSETIHSVLNEDPTPLAAFGELGLDYDHLEKASKDVQIRVFKAQLDMIIEQNFDLPLFLHCREAFSDFVEIIEPYLPKLPRRGLVHSFVGSKAEMEKLVSLNLDISVNGFSFRDESTCDMVQHIPLHRIQIETDAPWGSIPANSDAAKRFLMDASPLPSSKKKDKFQLGCMVKDRNESCTIERVARVVAGLKGIDVGEVVEAALTNSTGMFGLGGDETGTGRDG